MGKEIKPKGGRHYKPQNIEKMEFSNIQLRIK